MDQVLAQFEGGQSVQTLQAIVKNVRDESADVLSMDIKSAVLGLLRTQRLELTDTYDLRKPAEAERTAGV